MVNSDRRPWQMVPLLVESAGHTREKPKSNPNAVAWQHSLLSMTSRYLRRGEAYWTDVLGVLKDTWGADTDRLKIHIQPSESDEVPAMLVKSRWG